MEVLFFNCNDTLENTSKIIFGVLELSKLIEEGDSSFAKGGYYHSVEILGLGIKLEQNSYDYEDKYNYSLFVKKNPISNTNLIPRELEQSIAIFIAHILYFNLKIDVAIEVENEVKLLFC